MQYNLPVLDFWAFNPMVWLKILIYVVSSKENYVFWGKTTWSFKNYRYCVKRIKHCANNTFKGLRYVPIYPLLWMCHVIFAPDGWYLSWESLKSRLSKFSDTDTDIWHVQTKSSKRAEFQDKKMYFLACFFFFVQCTPLVAKNPKMQ